VGEQIERVLRLQPPGCIFDLLFQDREQVWVTIRRGVEVVVLVPGHQLLL